nr:unnamed protein product [Callosobruchus analis]
MATLQKSVIFQQDTPSPVEESYIGGRIYLIEALKRANVPGEALITCLASFTDATINQYNSSLHMWWKFCATNNINVFTPSKETKTIRGHIQDHLFVTFKKSHHPASTQTISRWLKATLKLSGVDVNLSGAHSTRHAFTSSAAQKGVHYDSIRLAAAWTEKSKMLTTYLSLPIVF